jgi:small subunit ribosomal protein S3
VVEVPARETDALLVAKSIASQIELRKPVKRVMERTATDAIRMGALGIKIKAKGRINGAEMTRAYQQGEGVMRLQSFRSNANYAQAFAYTKYGVIGVKVWVLLPSIRRKPIVKSKEVNN